MKNTPKTKNEITDFIDNQKLLDRLSDYYLDVKIQKHITSDTLWVDIIDNSTDDEVKIGGFKISLNDDGKVDLEEFISELKNICNDFDSDYMIREYANGYDEWRREIIVNMYRDIEKNLNDFTFGLNIADLYEVDSLADVKTLKDLEYVKDLNELSNETIDSMYLELCENSKYSQYIELFENTKDLWLEEDISYKEFQIAVLSGDAKDCLCSRLEDTTNHCNRYNLNNDEKEQLVKVANKLDIRPAGSSAYDDDFLKKYGDIGTTYGNNSPELISLICNQFCKELEKEIQDYEFKNVDFAEEKQNHKSKQK